MIDLKGIYTKERAESGKIPARFPTKPSTIGFASRRRTWGIGSRKNLMKRRLKCHSAKSMSCAVKKASL